MNDRPKGYLLDTSAFLQAVGASATLTRAAETILRDSGNACFTSAIVAWELTLLAERGRIRLPQPPAEYFAERTRMLDLIVIDVTLADIAVLPQIHAQVPEHRDPFDRVLLATAKSRELTIISSDRIFASYDVPFVMSKA